MHAFRNSPGDKVPGGSSTSVVLRDIVDADLAPMLALWHELMDLHVALDARFALAENADQRFFRYLESARNRDDYRVRVAACDEVPVGFSVSCILPNSPVYRARWIGYINDLCVTRSFRKRGIGAQLAEDAVSWLVANGAECVEVYVAKRNKDALSFWRRIGGEEYLERLSIDLDRFTRRNAGR